MIDDLVRQQAQLQRQVDGIVVPELSPDLISPFLAIPGLVGFWPMSSVQRSTGNAYDLSGQARTLTYTGNPTYNFTGVAPYIDLDGAGDYLIRNDETDLDILGTETIYAAAARGLTMGGWFYPTAFNGTFMAKHDATGNQRAYLIFDTGAGVLRGQISSDGTNAFTTDSATQSLNTWLFTVLRFIPSTSLTIFVNKDTPVANTVGIPATLNNSTANFIIGGRGAGTGLLTGRASLCFLSGNALSDGKISSLFQQTRGAFGV